MRNYIVVTGGAGFIGSNLIERLIKESKLNIISLDNYSTGSIRNHVKDKRGKYINADTYLSPSLGGKYLIFDPNIFAT